MENNYKSGVKVRTSKTTFEKFDSEKITKSLIRETGLDENTSREIAKKVEEELQGLKLEYVTAPLIREIANVKLIESGLEEIRAKYTRLGMPVYDVKNLIEIPSKENANLQYNPESIHKLLADQVSKEYALINVLPLELADAHMAGEIHIHDLDYFIRPFCLPGEEKVIITNPMGEILTTEIGKFVDSLMEENGKVKNIGENEVVFSPGYKAFSFDSKSYRTQSKEITAVSRRKNNGEKIIALKTKWSKRTIKATENHEIFIWENCIKTKKLKDVKKGDRLIIPLKLPDTNEIEEINLIDEFLNQAPESDLRTVYVRNFSEYKKFLKKVSGKNLQEIFDQAGIKYYWNSIPILKFKKLYEKFGLPPEIATKLALGVSGSENELDIILEFSPELMKLLGYFVGDGNYDINPKPPKQSYNLAITSSNPQIQRDIQNSIEKYSRYATWHRDDNGGRGDQVYFGGKLLYLVFRYVFGINPGAKQKNIPRYLFNASIDNVSDFLSAYYSSDGHLNIAEKYSLFRAECDTVSETLCSDLCYLFGRFGILPSTSIRKSEKYSDIHRIGIGGIEQIEKFREHINFIDTKRNQKLQNHSVKPQGSGSPLTKNRIGDVVFEEVDSVEIEENSSGYLYDLVINETHNFLAGENGPVVIHNCFSHDIRFFLKNGFKADGVGNHTAIAGPAKRPEVAFLHAAKILAASQTNCSGGQGFSYLNTFLSPFVQGLDYKKIKQLAQMFIYEMSVDGKEKIPILEDNKFRIIEIGELVDKYMEEHPNEILKNQTGQHILRRDFGIKTISLDDKNDTVWAPIIALIKHKAKDPLLEITTKSGRRVRITKDHSIYKIHDNKLLPIKGSDLKEGEEVALLQNISLPPTFMEHINLFEELRKRIGNEEISRLRVTNLGSVFNYINDKKAKEFLGIDGWHLNEIKEGRRTTPFKKFVEFSETFDLPSDLIKDVLVTSSTYSKKKYYLPLHLPLSGEFLKLVGYYVAEGYTNSHDIGMGVGIGFGRKEKELHEDLKSCVKEVFRADAYEAEPGNFRFGGKLAVILFKEILNLGTLAHHKKFPSDFMMLPTEKLSIMLRAYFDGDGCTSRGKSKYVAVDTTSEILKDQLILLLLRFGIVLRANIRDRRNKEIIIKGNKVKNVRKLYRLQINRWSEIARYFDQIGIAETKNNFDLSEVYQRAELYPIPTFCDVTTEKIKSIKEVKASNGYVYDIEVPTKSLAFHNCSGFCLMDSQMYVARGGQVVFSSIDCDMTVPKQFRDIPAILPGGEIKDSVTYSDFEDETRNLFNAILDVYLEGDYIGKPFNFPKFEVQVYPEDLRKGKNTDELMKVSELAAKFGTPYYIINQPYMPAFACYQSMPWDEKILILKDGRILPVEIGRYVDGIIEKNGCEKGNGLEGEVELSPADDYAISFNPETLNVEKRKIAKVMRHKTREKILRLTLDGNRALAATEKHKIPVVRDNEIKEVRMEDLKTGDFVLGLKNLRINLGFDSRLRFKGKGIELDKDLTRLLGYFASEGYIHLANKKNMTKKVCFSFNQSEKEYIEDVSNILKKIFSLEPKFDISEKNKTTTIYVYDKPLVELFTKELKTGTDARTKRVPERLLSAPGELLEEFLLGMFRGDGHLSRGIDLRLCNKELIDDIFLLTLRIGIPFEFVPRENSYHLRLTNSQRVDQFMQTMPFAPFNGEIPLKTVDFYDGAPVEPFNITREHTKTGHLNGAQIGKRATERGLELGDNLFTRFINSDLHLFEVKRIDEVKSDYVYDLIDVEQHHNFANTHGIFSSNCCSFLMPLDDSSTEDDVRNGTIRGGGLQVITINLPQIAYGAKGNDDKFFEILRDRMEKAKKVLLLKRDVIKRNLKNNLLPFMNQPVNEKERYLEVDKQSYIIGMVGMNEAVKAHTGEDLHESENAWKFGLKVMKKMKDIVAEFRQETKLIFALARTPAESSAYRLAQIDQKKYGAKAIVNGGGEAAYYTNSFHVRPSADVPLWKRLTIEGAFHPLTGGGAMSHIWLSERNPSPEGIYELTKKIATKTAIQYFAFTKDLSVCSNCNFTTGGLADTCSNCGSKNIDWWSRITGYYQNVAGWNKGKLAELMDRRRYGVSDGPEELPPSIKKKLSKEGKASWNGNLDF